MRGSAARGFQSGFGLLDFSDGHFEQVEGEGVICPAGNACIAGLYVAGGKRKHRIGISPPRKSGATIRPKNAVDC
jgi:hypothetical protein